MDESSRGSLADPDRFTTTLWSLVFRAGEKGDGSEQALTALCETYWYPLYAYARRRGHGIEDAQDLTQAFFERLLARDFFARANPERGRFRAFLLTAFKHFLANQRSYAAAGKRGGGQRPVSLDDPESHYRQEPGHDLTPEALYERQWALTVIANTLGALEAEAERTGRRRQFDAWRPLLASDDQSYDAVAAALDMSNGAVRVAVHRLRARFAQLLRERIAETVDSTAAVEDELRHLLATVASQAR